MPSGASGMSHSTDTQHTITIFAASHPSLPTPRTYLSLLPNITLCIPEPALSIIPPLCLSASASSAILTATVLVLRLPDHAHASPLSCLSSISFTRQSPLTPLSTMFSLHPSHHSAMQPSSLAPHSTIPLHAPQAYSSPLALQLASPAIFKSPAFPTPPCRPHPLEGSPALTCLQGVYGSGSRTSARLQLVDRRGSFGVIWTVLCPVPIGAVSRQKVVRQWSKIPQCGRTSVLPLSEQELGLRPRPFTAGNVALNRSQPMR